MDHPDARVAKLAAKQLGVFTRAQATGAEQTRAMIDTRVSRGRWDVIHPGVYRIAGTPPTWRQAVVGACFSAGTDAAASHVTAGVLWGLVERKRRPIVVTVPYGCGPHGLGFVLHRSRVSFVVEHLDGVPVTSVPRTLLDLVGTVPIADTEAALDAALHRRLVRIDELDAYLTSLGRSTRRGLGALRRLVAERAGRERHPVGTFATRVSRILSDAGVPQPQLEYEVRRDGHLLGTVDICYPDERIFIELDGWEWHSSRQAFDRDHIRRNLIVELGFVPIGFTWSDLDRPRYVSDTVLRILRLRGHPAL